MFDNHSNKLLHNLKSFKSLNEVAKRSKKIITLCIILGIYASVLFFCLCCAAALFLKIHPISQSTTSNSMGAFKQEKNSKNNPEFLEIPILNSCSERNNNANNDEHDLQRNSCSKGGL